MINANENSDDTFNITSFIKWLMITGGINDAAKRSFLILLILSWLTLMIKLRLNLHSDLDKSSSRWSASTQQIQDTKAV